MSIINFKSFIYWKSYDINPNSIPIKETLWNHSIFLFHHSANLYNLIEHIWDKEKNVWPKHYEDEILEGALGDQKRVLSPEKAFSSGADYLVIGRSLTQSAHLDKRIEHLANLK